MDLNFKFGDGFNLKDSDVATDISTLRFDSNAKKNTGLTKTAIRPGTKVPVPTLKRKATVRDTFQGMTMDNVPDSFVAELPGSRRTFTYERLTGTNFKVFSDNSNGKKLLGKVKL